MRELDSDKHHEFRDLFYQVTEIVTSHSLARSRASGTSFPSLFSSSSTSNIVKSTPRLSL